MGKSKEKDQAVSALSHYSSLPIFIYAFFFLRHIHSCTHSHCHVLHDVRSVIAAAGELGEGGGEGLRGIRVLLPLALLRRLQLYRVDCRIRKLKDGRVEEGTPTRKHTEGFLINTLTINHGGR